MKKLLLSVTVLFLSSCSVYAGSNGVIIATEQADQETSDFLSEFLPIFFVLLGIAGLISLIVMIVVIAKKRRHRNDDYDY